MLGGFAACTPQARTGDGLPVGYAHLTLPVHLPEEPQVSGDGLKAVVWYPAAAGSQQTPQRYASVFLGLAAQDAPLAPPTSPRPMVLLAHGLRGSAYDMSWLAERLAQVGYVAVAITQPGVDADSYDRRLAPKVWRRAALLSAAVDALLADKTWGPAIDANQLVAVGHSAGGSAALALVGAKPDEARFLRRYPDSGPVPTTAATDGRFLGAIGLAPGTARVFADADLARVARPVLLVSGDGDVLTPEADNAARYAAQIPHASWQRLPGTGHYVFKPRCSLYGRLRARQICRDCQGVDRQAAHEQTARWVRTFLAQVLQGAALHTAPELLPAGHTERQQEGHAP